MDYNEFIQHVFYLTEIKLGAKYEVTIKNIRKNNNVVLDGLTIRKENESISPTIYLNQYYPYYMEGDTIEEIVEEIIALYKANQVQDGIDATFFTEFEQVKDKIVYKIIHYDKNKILLEQIPHIRFLDLAIVFYYLVRSDQAGNATILIYNSHLEMWGKKLLEIYKIAKINTQELLECKVDYLKDVIEEELGEELWRNETKEDIPMYVLSNRTKLNGAVCILYENVLKDLSKVLSSNLFLLPSSVHEIIIIPKSCKANLSDLKEMVKDTNNYHVEAEEILSYNVYEYVREEDCIKISS